MSRYKVPKNSFTEIWNDHEMSMKGSRKFEWQGRTDREVIFDEEDRIDPETIRLIYGLNITWGWFKLPKQVHGGTILAVPMAFIEVL